MTRLQNLLSSSDLFQEFEIGDKSVGRVLRGLHDRRRPRREIFAPWRTEKTSDATGTSVFELDFLEELQDFSEFQESIGYWSITKPRSDFIFSENMRRFNKFPCSSLTMLEIAERMSQPDNYQQYTNTSALAQYGMTFVFAILVGCWESSSPLQHRYQLLSDIVRYYCRQPDTLNYVITRVAPILLSDHSSSRERDCELRDDIEDHGTPGTFREHRQLVVRLSELEKRKSLAESEKEELRRLSKLYHQFETPIEQAAKEYYKRELNADKKRLQDYEDRLARIRQLPH